MDVRVGDILEMKKQHPCGNKRFRVLRVGMDFKIKCEQCGHEIMPVSYTHLTLPTNREV